MRRSVHSGGSLSPRWHELLTVLSGNVGVVLTPCLSQVASFTPTASTLVRFIVVYLKVLMMGYKIILMHTIFSIVYVMCNILYLK